MATLVQLAIILTAVAPALAIHIWRPLAFTGCITTLIGGFSVWLARDSAGDQSHMNYGRAFALSQAVLFAVIVAAALLTAAALQTWMGTGGTLVAAIAAGFADVHAAAVTVGQLTLEPTTLPLEKASMALIGAFTANCLMKCISATTGGLRYAFAIVVGIVLINAAFIFSLLFYT